MRHFKKAARFLAIALILVAAAFVFAACSGGDVGENPGEQGGTTQPGDNPGGDGGNVTPPALTSKPADYLSFDNDGKTAIYKYSGQDKEILLPSVHEGKTVSEIYFSESDYEPFAGTPVEIIHIPASITSIFGDSNPFIGAEHLKKIVVAPENPAFASEDGVLYDKQKKKMIACPYDKTDALVLPDSVEIVPKSALKYRFSSGNGEENALTSDFTNFGTFSARVSSVKLSANLKEFSFEGCRELASVDFGNSNLEAIPLGAFRQCFSLRAITLPATVKYVGTGAFQNSGIETFEIRKEARGLDVRAASDGSKSFNPASEIFTGCKNLKKITAPAQLLFGEYGASGLYIDQKQNRNNNFAGCVLLEEIVVNGVEPGTGGKAWSVADYENASGVSDAKSVTFPALKKLEFAGGCGSSAALNRSAESAFLAAYPNVSIVG